MNKAFITISLVTLILTSILNTLVFFGDSQEWVIENVSFKSSANTPVYPGSRGAQLVLDARYNGVLYATSPIACLSGIPEAFTALSKCSISYDGENKPLTQIGAGEIARFIFSLDVDRNAQPGLYEMGVNITYYTTEGGLQYSLLPITVEIIELPPLEITTEAAYFTPYAYPGANNVGLAVKIRNNGSTSILVLDASVSFPDLVTPSSANVSLAGIQPGESATIYVQGLTISPHAQPGEYLISIRLNATLTTPDGIRYSSSTTVQATVSVYESPGINLEILDYGFTADTVLSGLNNTNIYVTIQSYESGVVSIIYYRAEIFNAFFQNKSQVKIGELNAVLNYLDTYSFLVDGVSIVEGSDSVLVLLTLNSQVSREGATFPSSINITLYMPVASRVLSINVSRVEWASVNAYPSSTGNTLVVSVLNQESFNLRDVTATLNLPSVFYPQTITVYNAVINAYSALEISFPGIAVSSTAQPGRYPAEITIHGFIVNNDGSTCLVTLVFNIEVVISDLDQLNQFTPELKILDYYWGDGTPIHVYPGNSRAPLTITLQNIGLFSVSDVVVSLEPVDSDVTVLNTRVLCSLGLNPGGVCSAVFYIDLSNSIPGNKEFVVNVTYYVNAFNTAVFFETTRTISVTLPSHPAGEGVVLAEYRWLNNYPAYPGSEKASYFFSIVNLEAYPVYSMWIELKTPEGVKISQGYPQRIYVAGPVQSLQTLSYSIPLDISGNLTPGVYSGLIVIEYYLQTMGGGVRKTVSFPVELFIQDASSAFSLISYGWLSGEPSPPTKGVKYMLIFRNENIPTMTNPMLKLQLPQGITDAATGEASTNVTPITMPGGLSGTTSLAQLVQYITGGLPGSAGLPGQSSSYGKGDIIAFILNLNVEAGVSDRLQITGTIEFVDHWGSTYRQPVSIPLIIRGSPVLIEVNVTSPLIVFNNGTGMLELEINNPSSYSAYEVYVALTPLTGNAVPQGNVKYVPVLPGNTRQILRYEVVYNPVSISVGAGVSATPSSAAFTVTLIYKDPSGYVKMLNNTVAAVIKPFIELQVADETNAKYSDGVLTVNGLLYNVGVSQARSVMVFLKYRDKEVKTLMGDLDPGSQSPFRLEIRNIGLTNETCTLIVSYRDNFNIEYSITKEVSITVIQPSPTLTTPPTPAQIPYIVIIAIISLFLVGVFMLIYRLLSKYKISMVER